MKTKKKKRAITLAIILIIITSGIRLSAEYVFLKDGTIIKCAVSNETPGSITVLTDEKKAVTYRRGDIVRILYTNLHLGKQYIQKTDGAVVEAFIIDENQDDYTVRMELNSPKEFTIKRDTVLFITRKNPSGLQGRVARKYVDLSWNAPYNPINPVKYYTVYIREKGGTYRAAGRTGQLRYRVTGLLCNTEYSGMITATDKTNHESLPGNEVRMMTLKGMPTPPRTARVSTVTSNGGRLCTAHLSWDTAVDPCGGVITGYGIYIKDDSAASNAADPVTGKRFPGYRFVGTTSGTAYRIENLKDATRYNILITSLDNMKSESTSGLKIALTTKNIPPDYPYPVICRKTVSPGSNDLTVKLSWNGSKDPDGSVKEYRVYKKGPGGADRIGASEGAEFEVRGLSPDEKHIFTVRTVDNRGGESADSYPAATGLLRYLIVTARPSFLLPLGNFSRLYKPGYGGLLSLSVENLFFERIVIGAETGYFHYAGRSDRSRETSIIPLYATASYRIPLNSWFSIDPAVGFGGCYIRSRDMINTFVPAELFFARRYRVRSGYDLLFSGGITAAFAINKIALVQTGVTYIGIIESGGVMGSLAFSLGAGARVPLF